MPDADYAALRRQAHEAADRGHSFVRVGPFTMLALLDEVAEVRVLPDVEKVAQALWDYDEQSKLAPRPWDRAFKSQALRYRQRARAVLPLFRRGDA